MSWAINAPFVLNQSFLPNANPPNHPNSGPLTFLTQRAELTGEVERRVKSMSWAISAPFFPHFQIHFFHHSEIIRFRKRGPQASEWFAGILVRCLCCFAPLLPHWPLPKGGFIVVGPVLPQAHIFNSLLFVFRRKHCQHSRYLLSLAMRSRYRISPLYSWPGSRRQCP